MVNQQSTNDLQSKMIRRLPNTNAILKKLLTPAPWKTTQFFTAVIRNHFMINRRRRGYLRIKQLIRKNKAKRKRARVIAKFKLKKYKLKLLHLLKTKSLLYRALNLHQKNYSRGYMSLLRLVRAARRKRFKAKIFRKRSRRAKFKRNRNVISIKFIKSRKAVRKVVRKVVRKIMRIRFLHKKQSHFVSCPKFLTKNYKHLVKKVSKKNARLKPLTEQSLVRIYQLVYLAKTNWKIKRPKISILKRPFIYKNNAQLKKEKIGYVKYMVRLRYRWFFRRKLVKFKLFKKFFKRVVKRFRKISKNRLFVDKFRTHFSRLVGFKERALFRLWQPLRRNYNQYWSTTSAVEMFSRSIMLTPPSFLVFLRISSSLAASKYIIRSGAVSVNGLVITSLISLIPGDIMQINISLWKGVQSYFNYQRWSRDFKYLNHIPFLYIDWSSMMFMMVRWPESYELVAPSFLSERWVRYYVRLFPVKASRFRKARNNLNIYKRIVAKR